MGPDRPTTCHPPEWVSAITPGGIIERMGGLPCLPAQVAQDGRAVEPAPLPPGTVVYIDPPYQGTTPYEHALSRAEWLTMNRPAVVKPGQQMGLFQVPA
jgi:16S rRNA G966 N2-methylase RsmD